MEKNILILGSEGMLGNTVYLYLTKTFAGSIFGTSRKKTNSKGFYYLEVKSVEKDFNQIIKKICHIEYVINCIGVLKNSSLDELFFVNTDFPKKLSKLSKKYNFKLIHVSTDAVFSENAGTVTESDIPNPSDQYGESKLLGEPNSSNSISFRTSIIGFHPSGNRGILEWVLNNKSKSIPGYANQKWSGCTTLQFAKLCEDIIVNNKFSTLREISPVFHFVPIGPITKYELINEFLKASHLKKSPQKKEGNVISRTLQSLYFDYSENKKYTNNIKRALEELIAFEKKII